MGEHMKRKRLKRKGEIEKESKDVFKQSAKMAT